MSIHQRAVLKLVLVSRAKCRLDLATLGAIFIFVPGSPPHALDKPNIPAWSNQYAGSQLDLTGYSLAFSDEFTSNRLHSEQYTILGEKGHRIAPSGSWFAPVHPMPRSAVKYLDPDPQYRTSPVNPFSVADGTMTITMEKVNGQWQSGTMQTADWRNMGYRQKDGYFEMRAKFPGGRGTWPAFWLISQNNETRERIEYDIVEAYGTDPGHHTTIHARNSAGGTKQGDYTNLAGAMFDGQFHTYSGLITNDWIITYFDGKELARMPKPEIFDRANFHMIVTLAGNPKEMPYASGQNHMVIDYVRAYAPTATMPNPRAVRPNN